jgi:cytochrome c oxidase subunit II
MALAIIIALLVIGSVLFQFLSPWYFTPIASNWVAIDNTIGLTFWITGAVFVIVNLFVVYCIIRFRKRKGSKAEYEPENKKLEWWLIGITTIGIASMLAPGLFVWADFVHVPPNASLFEVVGKQWNWSYRFPGKDGKMGLVDTKFISEKNPFGIDPEDVNGQDDVLVSSQEVHLPLNKPVKALLRSVDVLHNFAVPQFRAKMDLVPGMITFIWFTPTRVGKFDVLCNELCGVGHYVMRGKVIIESDDAYQAWLSSYPTFSQTQTQKNGDAAAGQALYAVCSACHGAQGEGNKALNAPKLSGQAEWYLSRQLMNFKQGARGAKAQDVNGKVMVPMAATLVSPADVANVTSYIRTLPDTSVEHTIQGNISKGKDLYNSTCAACHGQNGAGVESTKAPRLKNMSDWYLVTQLNYFRDGVRGTHPKDLYGQQMSSVASFLTQEQTINDLVAYIGTLK